MKKLKVIFLLVLLSCTGCVTTLTCEEAGHKFMGEGCIRCGQPVPWLAGNWIAGLIFDFRNLSKSV
jgi:hypothetical protein